MKRAIFVSVDNSESVPNYWLRSLQDSEHLPPEHLENALGAAGLDRTVLKQPGTMITLNQEITVLGYLAEHNQDSLFPLRLGLSSSAKTGSVLSYILFASPSLEQGLSNLCEFVRLTRPRSQVELISRSDTIEFRMSHPDPSVQKAFAYREFVIGNVLNSMCVATQTSLIPERVSMALPIGNRAKKLSTCLGCEVEDAKGYTSITLKSSVRDLPIRSSDEQLLQHLTEYGRLLLETTRPQSSTMHERVYSFLLKHVSMGVPRISDAAKALALSERTLSRRLAEENTSYREIVDETRCAMADALLDDPSISLTEISYLLGFSDPGSFSNAYRRWTGQAPMSTRQRRRKIA